MVKSSDCIDFSAKEYSCEDGDVAEIALGRLEAHWQVEGHLVVVLATLAGIPQAPLIFLCVCVCV